MDFKFLQTRGDSNHDSAPPIRRERIGSRDLLGERGALIIEHDGRDYLLRVTQNGKLILTA